MAIDPRAAVDENIWRLESLLRLDAMAGPGGAPASATEATLQAIENLLKGDRAPSESTWTDNSGAYFLRYRSYNQELNAFEPPTYELPGGAAYTPVAGLRPASGTTDRELLTDNYTAKNTNTGYTAGDRVTKTVVYDLSVATPTIAATFWVNTDTGLQLASAPPQADLSPATVAATSRIRVVYRLNNGTLRTGYLGQLAPNPTLFADLIGNTPVTIGPGLTEADQSSIEPARSVYESVISFPIAHAAATLATFTQPTVGDQVAVTCTIETAAGSESQFSIGSSVFLADTDGVQIGGHYIVRSGTFPNLNIELQNPALNDIAIGQTSIDSGATATGMRMIALSRITPPVGATHATVSVTRPAIAKASAISGINSGVPATQQQAQRDAIQVQYPSVAMNYKPSTLGWDAGAKDWVFDTLNLSAEQLNFYIHAWADQNRTAHCTVRWFGGAR